MPCPSIRASKWQILVTIGQAATLGIACSSGGSNAGDDQIVANAGNGSSSTSGALGGASFALGGKSSSSIGGGAQANSIGGSGDSYPSQGGASHSTVVPTTAHVNGGATTETAPTTTQVSGSAGRTSQSSGVQGGAVSGGASASTRGGTATRGGTSARGGASSSIKSSGGTAGIPSAGAATFGGAPDNGSTAGARSTIGGTSSTQPAGGSTGAAGAAFSSILEPVTGALLGLYYGDASISATTTKLGRSIPLHLTYYAWSDDWTSGETTADLNAGRIPFVCWELFGATLADIASGKYDSQITQRATSAKKLGKKLFVDFGAEMNGDWSPWSGAENGQSSDSYIAAYRHVHDLFVAAGATNVIWAFCPNVTSEPDASWNEPLDYYPGDSYVDWMCVDGYNWGSSSAGDAWQSFYQVFQDIYPVLASKNKPIVIGEMASTELGGDKAKWIADIIPTMKSKFPLLKGLNWFDINKETDWRISSSAASEAAFKQMANDPWFVSY